MRNAFKPLVAALCASGALGMMSSARAADDALVARGAYLAKAGDCIACHSAPRGKPLAGGLPMMTPVGAIYTTNITPDPETGIGRYTEEEFARALREGVAKDGHNLYPAMPYPSYAKINDEDMHALYAYFMQGVTPVKQANREPDMKWPLNMRWPLKVWNAVFLDKGIYQNKTGKDVAWNRGAYLIQGLGHCGSCHTPRGIAFQEKGLDESSGAYLTGGLLDNWFASNLTGEHNTGLGRWSEQDIATFLKTGANAHASAFGSMTSVITTARRN
ncbi:cytochrome c, class I [Caballeronia cordobensis]|uniref:Cytochrome c, class I n=1 Tax=Caballeronia cordobensis TaxID=1353886 RepID=A0A158H0Y1_CABCO|nr:cytochrome c, class I [Caballeronia cordobensis]